MTTFAVGDTATYLHGNHIIKFGGEVRAREALQLQSGSGHLHVSQRRGVPAGLRQRSSRITLGTQRVQRVRQRHRRIRPGFDLARARTSSSISACATTTCRRRRSRTTSSSRSIRRRCRCCRSTAPAASRRSRRTAATSSRGVGVIWNPTGDGKTVVRGAYAVDGEPEQHRLLHRRDRQSADRLAAVGAGQRNGGEQHQAGQRASQRRRGPPRSRRRSPIRTSCPAGCRRGTSTSSARSAAWA